MNIIDIIVGISLLIGVIIGIKNGFFIELASIAGILLGFYLADKFTLFIIEYLSISGEYAFEIGYIIMIVLVIFAVWLLAKALTELFSAINIGFINRIAGGLVGGLKVVLIMSILAKLLNAGIIGEQTISKSYLYPKLICVSDTVYPYLEKSIDKTVNYFKEKIDE